MKTYKYIALAVLALGFTACSQDDDFTPQQEDIVQIVSANIATEVQTRVNTLGDGTLFENADQILLINNSRTNKNNGTYTYDGTNWNLTTGTILYASSGTNDFTAYYPASVDFTLPADQSTESGIMSADRMVATTSSVAKGAAVALSFERQNAMVTITPSFNTEFGSDATISGLQIAGITSYHPASATDYKAIIAPCTNFEVTVKVKVGETEQTLTAASTTAIEAGNHYTFSLTVGKAAVEIADVNVTPWTEQTIDGVDTEEAPCASFIEGTTLTLRVIESATSDDITSAVSDALDAGCTTLNITLPADAGVDMFQGITAALAADGITAGSIDLTISGAKTVPEEGICDLEDYSLPSLRSITLPDVTEIEGDAIFLCENLISVSAPKCEILGRGALSDNASLTSVYLPVARIIGSNKLGQYGVFTNCTSLTEISLPEATQLGSFTFNTCTSLKNIYCPKVTEVWSSAFCDCMSLEKITLGTLTTVDDGNIRLFNQKTTENIDLVLSPEQKVMNYDDGTKIYTAGTEAFDFNTTSFIGYTFKSISKQE